jgi:hypothetical protein
MSLKLALIKPGCATRLQELSRRIKSREQTIKALDQSVDKAADACVCEIILQGQDLLEAKDLVNHGSWMEWVRSHFPGSHSTALNWMWLAEKFGGHSQQLTNLIRQGYSVSVLYALRRRASPAVDSEEPKKLPPPIFVLLPDRTCALVRDYMREDRSRWPAEAMQKLRADVQPLAADLWPEKFA